MHLDRIFDVLKPTIALTLQLLMDLKIDLANVLAIGNSQDEVRYILTF
jgi:hypothetical protein